MTLGACVGGAIGLPCAPAGAAPQPSAAIPTQPAAPVDARRDAAALLEQFKSASSTPDQRAAAAAGLLSLPDSAGRAALHEGLLNDVPPGVRRAAAQALSKAANPPRELLPALSQALDPADRATKEVVIQALSRYRIRDAVRPIMALIQDDETPADPSLVTVATRALAVQTGYEEPGADPAKWRAWWQDARRWSDLEYRTRVADALASQSVELRRQRDELAARLTETYRRLHASMNEDERQTLIAELLRQDSTELRSLGLDLIQRALANAQRLSEPVVQAVVAALADANTPIRAAAAGIVQKLSRADLSPAVAKALDSESDPATAAPLLTALAANPQPGTIPAILRWLESPGPARSAAIDATLGLESAGLLADPAVRDRARAAIESLTPSEHSPGSIRLVARLSGPQAIAKFLVSNDARLAAAAGDVFASDPATLDALVDAARANSSLFEPAVRALMRLRPNPAGLEIARSLPAPDTTLAERLLAEYTRAIAPAELLKAADAIADPLRRIGYLAPVLRREYARDQRDLDQRRALVELGARTNFDLGRPADALANLDLLDPEPDARPLDALRCTALLWLGRLDRAAELINDGSRPTPIPASALLDGFEHSLSLPHAAAVRETINPRVDSMTPADRERFADLCRRLTERQSGAPQSP